MDAGTRLPLVHELNLPRWFGLSFRFPTRTKPPAILFRLRESNLKYLNGLLAKHMYVEMYGEMLGTLLYTPNLSYMFGFDSCMVADGLVDGYWQLALPLKPKPSIFAAVASCSVLLDVLSTSFPEVRKGADPKRIQLLALRAWYNSNPSRLHMAPMGGFTAPMLRAWTEKEYEKRIKLPEVEEAMWQTWNALSEYPIKKRALSPSPFEGLTAYLKEKGSFFFDCPGNATSVFTDEWWDVGENRGHTLASHNLDSPLQQVTLLAGLAALHDLVDKDSSTTKGAGA
jgi:hypothetical protein